MTVRSAYGPLLAQLFQDTSTRRQLIRISLLLMAGEILLLWYGAGPGDFGKLIWVCLPWVVSQMWCGAFLNNAIRQNRPEYACLVPHLRPRLIRLSAALYGADAALLGWMSWLVFGHAGYGLMFAGMVTVIGIFSSRYNVLGWLLAVLIPMAASFVMTDLMRLLATFNEAALTAAVMAPLLLLGGWGLHLLLPRGGDQHWRWQSRFIQRADALAGKPGKSSAGQQPSRLKRLMQLFYLTALRRDSQSGVTAQRALMHVIGPGAHPGRAIACSLSVTLAALLLGCLMSDSTRAGMLITTSLLQLGAVLLYAIGVADDVVLHSAEQQLFLLTPAAPAAARINRLLTLTVLRRALAVWLVSLACATGLDSMRSGHVGLSGTSFALAMGMLWTLLPLLRNYAIVPGKRLGVEWSVTVVLALLVLACLGAVALTQAAPDFPWYQVGSATGIGALIYLGLRWRALMTLPAVLPAGRLAV